MSTGIIIVLVLVLIASAYGYYLYTVSVAKAAAEVEAARIAEEERIAAEEAEAAAVIAENARIMGLYQVPIEKDALPGYHKVPKHSWGTPPNFNTGNASGTLEEKAEACNEKDNCIGFSTDGWMAAKSSGEDGYDLQTGILLKPSSNDYYAKKGNNIYVKYGENKKLTGNNILPEAIPKKSGSYPMINFIAACDMDTNCVALDNKGNIKNKLVDTTELEDADGYAIWVKQQL